MNDYNLIYIENSTGKKYEGKRITSSAYMLRDPETGLKISINGGRLRKNFSSDIKNNVRQREGIKKVWKRVAF